MQILDQLHIHNTIIMVECFFCWINYKDHNNKYSTLVRSLKQDVLIVISAMPWQPPTSLN